MKKIFFLSLLITVIAFSGWQEGVQLFKEKKFKEAIPHFEDVVKNLPDGYSGHYMLGLCYFYLNDLNKAAESLKRAVELKPQEGEVGHKYLTVLIKQKKYEEAHSFVKNYKEEYVPKELKGEFYKLAGIACYKVQDWKYAKSFFEKAEAMVNGDEVPYYLGISAFQLQEYDIAVDSFQKAYQRNPKNIDALENKVKVLLEWGRVLREPDEKIKKYSLAYQEAIKLLKEREDFDHLLTVSEAALGAQKYQEALSYLEKALQIKKNDGYVFLYRGQAYSNLEKYEESIESLNQALNYLPEEKKKIAYNQLGFVYEKLKNFDKAKENYILAKNDKKAQEMDLKKKMEEENKKAEEALKEYEKKKKEQEQKK